MLSPPFNYSNVVNQNYDHVSIFVVGIHPVYQRKLVFQCISGPFNSILPVPVKRKPEKGKYQEYLLGKMYQSKMDDDIYIFFRILIQVLAIKDEVGVPTLCSSLAMRETDVPLKNGWCFRRRKIHEGNLRVIP
ncbi:hypothetical protein RF11_10094 [Thelohanellus kitauei]|uniref:Uncharacterized protein n=1 Tax=Thelohanellus kitauei TaxID=669202 RepID=A0A0C2MJL5_THEKT|nr:hypothetical protein RF11_10094 [Thelohanellus kitauei]